GVLYTLTDDPTLLVAIQILDGVGAGIFNVVSVLVVADLTRGTGRFNLTLGALTTAVGVGAATSQLLGGAIAHRAGYHAAFVSLGGIAACALLILWRYLPETRRSPSTAP